jgi:hypothetical protein
MSEVNTQQQCKVRYVYIEMILNKETKYDVVAGLFKGIVEKAGEIFILLHGLKNATAVLNTKFYNIMSLEVMEEEYKNMTYLTSEVSDQELANQMLSELNILLLDNDFGMKNDTKIIDIEKYQDVPVDYKDGKPINKDDAAAGAKASGVGSFAAPGTRYQPPASGVLYSKTNATKDPEPSIFSRSTTKKPAKANLELMREKIEHIMAGDYEHELPETVGDVPVNKDAKTADDDDDYYDNMYGGQGAFC